MRCSRPRFVSPNPRHAARTVTQTRGSVGDQRRRTQAGTGTTAAVTASDGLDPPRRSRSVPGRGGGPATPGARRPPGRGGRRRRPRPGTAGRGDGVVRGSRVRRAVGDAAEHRGAQVSRSGVPADGSPGVRSRVGPGDGGVAVARGGGRGVGLGRGVRRGEHGRSGRLRPPTAGDRVRRHRDCGVRSGSGRPSCSRRRPPDSPSQGASPA